MAEKEVATITMASPPAYKEDKPEKKPKSKALWGLMFYAGAVTAALITVCVFGAIAGMDEDNFQLTPNNKPEPKPEVKHYQSPRDKDGDSDEADIDVGRDREVFRKINADGQQTITVLDFEKSIGGIYHGPSEACFLMRDLEGLPHAGELVWNLDQKHSGEGNKTVEYVVDTASPVTDMSLVPSEMVTPCWGKDVHWLERGTHEDGARGKRAIRWCYWVRIGWWYYRYCWTW